MKPSIIANLILGIVFMASACRTPQQQPTPVKEAREGQTTPQISNEEAKKRIDIIMAKVSEGWDGPIYDLADIHHPSVIPILEALYQQEDAARKRLALDVLAKLQVKNYYAQLIKKCIKDLRAYEDALRSHVYADDGASDNAFRSLGYVGGNDGIRLLAKYLFDDSMPLQESDNFNMPNCRIAVLELRKVIPESEWPTKTLDNKEDFLAWREWWLKNKDKYK